MSFFNLFLKRFKEGISLVSWSRPFQISPLRNEIFSLWLWYCILVFGEAHNYVCNIHVHYSTDKVAKL